MSHSKVSDQALEVMIHNTQMKLNLLLELQKSRNAEKPSEHRWTEFKKARGRATISEVTCSCGKTTRYIVPLKLLDDFKCPKDPVR
jgi:hypothetical protein